MVVIAVFSLSFFLSVWGRKKHVSSDVFYHVGIKIDPVTAPRFIRRAEAVVVVVVFRTAPMQQQLVCLRLLARVATRRSSLLLCCLLFSSISSLTAVMFSPPNHMYV